MSDFEGFKRGERVVPEAWYLPRAEYDELFHDVVMTSPVVVTAVGVAAGISAGLWPSLTVLCTTARNALIMFNFFFSLGVLCTSLGLLLLSTSDFHFSVYGVLSGALLATGTSITFVSQTNLGITTTYSLVVAVGMLTRFGWDVFFLHSQLSLIFLVPITTLALGILTCIRLHEAQVRAGIAFISLDLFGVGEMATARVEATSIAMLKVQIRRHFWEAYMDVGNIEKLLLLNDSKVFVELRCVAQLPPAFEGATLRVVGNAGLIDNGEHVAVSAAISDSDNVDAQSRSLIEVPQASDAVLNLTEISKRIAQRKKSSGYVTRHASAAAMDRGCHRRRLQYFVTCLGGVCLGSVMAPALHEGYALHNDLPLVGLGGLLVAPAIPGDKCVSCVSFHLSRASNTNPLETPSSAIAVGLCAGVLWTASVVASSFCIAKSRFALIFAILPAAAGVNMAMGIYWHREFEGSGARHQLAVLGLLLASGAFMTAFA